LGEFSPFGRKLDGRQFSSLGLKHGTCFQETTIYKVQQHDELSESCWGNNFFDMPTVCTEDHRGQFAGNSAKSHLKQL
jgi:hypothetical protein